MNKIVTVSALALMLVCSGNAMAKKHATAGGGFSGPGIAVSAVADAVKLGDDTPVVLQGNIKQSLGDEKYLFEDASGTVTVEIDDDDWNGVNVTPENLVELHGEVDKDFLTTTIDVDRVVVKK